MSTKDEVISKKDEALKLAVEAAVEQYAKTGNGRVLEATMRQIISNEALNKMAENARELGLDYEPAQQQEPVAVYVGETWCGSIVRLYEDLPLETPLYKSPQPRGEATLAQQHGCSRSHPHENMDVMCELRTEIARLTNENARLKARHQDDEINAYRMTLLCIRDGLQQGMSKSIQKLQAREINDVLGLPSFASYRTSPTANANAGKPWVHATTWRGLTDEEKRQLFECENYDGWLDYINAIEAKLKEKNGF